MMPRLFGLLVLTMLASTAPQRARGATYTIADLGTIAAATAVRGPAWTLADRDLNANLIVLDSGQGIESHINNEVDVLIVGIAGQGSVTVDAAAYPLSAGRVVLVPKGSQRSISATTDRFAYLTCHRRRPGLWPTGATR